MNPILRHYALRLFTTAFLGTLICLFVLPHWHWLAEGNWVALPVALILAGCFVLLGWVMNRVGLALIRRQVAESAVWERAGMAAEAKAAFERVKSLYDSFMLSATARRQNVAWITMRLARFYLTQARPDREGLSLVMTYLRLHPKDEAVAVGWLESMLHRDTVTIAEQDTAAALSEALANNDSVQRLLMQFFLAHHRVDFEAMQTYRRMWQTPGELSESMTRELARVLLNETFIDDWALQVYLKAYSLGETDCMEGVAAGLQFLRRNPDNGPYLDQAREIISGLDEDRRRELARQFTPPPQQPERPDRRKSGEPILKRGRGLATLALSLGVMLGTALRRCLGAAGTLPRHAARLWRQTPAPRLRRAATAAIAIAACGVFIAVGWRWMGRTVSPPPAAVPTPAPVNHPLPTPVADPFTIQVAAYLKPEDAQHFVNRLKQSGIDAFSNKAVSANRTWYQVKVSHFATKDEAVKYGEMLKAKGLIDDFYVANFSQK